MSRRSDVATLLIFGVLLASLSAYALPRLGIETDIAAMLPAEEAADPALRAATHISRGPAARIVTLELRSAELQRTRVAGRRIAAYLDARDEVAWVGSRDGASEMQALAALIDAHPEALGGTSTTPDSQAVRAALARLRSLLASPIAADHVPHVVRDPFLARLDAWNRLASLAPEGTSIDAEGYRTSADGAGLVETFAFEADTTPESIAAVVARVESIADQASVSLRWSGAAPITAHATESIRGDIERVSIASTIGVLLLLGLMFGRLRYVFVASLPLAAATILALATCVFVFGKVHGIALAFGGAMIGVVVDYVEHFLVHRALAREGTSAHEVLAEIRPSLLLAAITTCVGISGFAFASYPGFRSITVVASAGIVGGLLTTLFVVPAALGPSTGPTRAQRWLASISRRLVAGIEKRRAPFGALIVLASVASASVLVRARTIDDPMVLSGVPPRLLADDQAVRSAVGLDRQSLVVTEASTCEAALERAEETFHRLTSRLPSLVAHGPHVFPGSLRTQRARIDAARSVDVAGVRALMQEQDYDVEAFAPYFEWRAGSDRSAVGLEALASVAPMTFGATFVRTHGSCSVLASVSGTDEASLVRALGDASNSTLVSTRAVYASAYRTMRSRISLAVAAGFLAVIVVCFVRYRSIRSTVAACAPAFVSALTAVALASVLGPLDLMHWLGALLVASLGVDYGIFFVDSRHADDAVDATFGSVVVSAMTNILSFGILGLSSHRALQSLGFTTSVGVTLAVLLAPAALVLLNNKGKT